MFVEFLRPLLPPFDLVGSEFFFEIIGEVSNGFGYSIRFSPCGLADDGPCVGLDEVMLDSLSVCVGACEGVDGKVESLLRRFQVPVGRLREVLLYSLTPCVGVSESELGEGVSLLRRFQVPVDRFREVFEDFLSDIVGTSEFELGLIVSCFCSLFKFLYALPPCVGRSECDEQEDVSDGGLCLSVHVAGWRLLRW